MKPKFYHVDDDNDGFFEIEARSALQAARKYMNTQGPPQKTVDLFVWESGEYAADLAHYWFSFES